MIEGMDHPATKFPLGENRFFRGKAQRLGADAQHHHELQEGLQSNGVSLDNFPKLTLYKKPYA